MDSKDFQAMFRAEPFQPFLIRLADGRAIPVRHQEFAIASPTGRSAFIYQPDGSFNIIDVRLVIDLEIEEGSQVDGIGTSDANGSD